MRTPPTHSYSSPWASWEKRLVATLVSHPLLASALSPFHEPHKEGYCIYFIAQQTLIIHKPSNSPVKFKPMSGFRVPRESGSSIPVDVGPEVDSGGQCPVFMSRFATPGCLRLKECGFCLAVVVFSPNMSSPS